MKFILFLVFLISSSICFANKKPVRIEFSDELIKGETVNPDLFYLLKRRQVSFKKLIPLRDNFLPELRRTSDYVESGRGR